MTRGFWPERRNDEGALLSNNSLGWLGGGALLGSTLGSLFGNDFTNPSEAAAPYFNDIPKYSEEYNPYIEAGQRALSTNEGLYKDLLQNPGGQLNHIGESYHESPGFRFALQQALGGANNSSAARGLTGTPQADLERMRVATGLADQDYNNWLGNALGLYQGGLTGLGHIQDTGYNALDEKIQDLMNTKLSQAQLAYAGQNTANQESSPFSSIFSGVSAALPFFSGL